MNQPYRPLSSLTSKELHQRAVQYRRMALNAHGLATASALEKLATRFALLAVRREIEENGRTTKGSLENTGQSELAKLIASVTQTAAGELNPVTVLANIIRTIAASDADPYLVIGVLLEGSVHTLASSIPCERQKDTAAALLQLITSRIRASGMLDGTWPAHQ
jgi:hypothetical protein